MDSTRSIDEVIGEVLSICKSLPQPSLCEKEQRVLEGLLSRLSRGEMHIAVIGQFNRGKSTFLNRLIGYDFLPTSVLPLTSLSTEICYDHRSSLRVSFINGDVKTYDGDDLQKVLKGYVAEQDNRCNYKGVNRVELFCPSQFLSHGTRLIDTPGFGSTHIHNTKATIDLLKDCDAVLFMLSADLPITQMELNFLRRVQPHVSKIICVYNKVDLISAEERVETENFILQALYSVLPDPKDVVLYPISALLAEESRISSGFEAIEQRLIDFIDREKYFTLAEAIDKKLKKVFNSLSGILQHEISCAKALIDERKAERDVLMQKEREHSLKQALIAEACHEGEVLKKSLLAHIDTLSPGSIIEIDESQLLSSSIESIIYSVTHSLQELFIAEVKQVSKSFYEKFHSFYVEFKKKDDIIEYERNEMELIKFEIPSVRSFKLLPWQVGGSRHRRLLRGLVDDIFLSSSETLRENYRKYVEREFSIYIDAVGQLNRLLELINPSSLDMDLSELEDLLASYEMAKTRLDEIIN